jgi:hypothetical protein
MKRISFTSALGTIGERICVLVVIGMISDAQSRPQNAWSYTTSMVLDVPHGLKVVEKPQSARLSRQRSTFHVNEVAISDK